MEMTEYIQREQIRLENLRTLLVELTGFDREGGGAAPGFIRSKILDNVNAQINRKEQHILEMKNAANKGLQNNGGSSE